MVVAVLTHFSEWMSAIISTVCLQSLDRISHIILCIILIDIAQIACSAVVFVFMFCLCFWDDYGSRGCYVNPQPALRPVSLLPGAQPSMCEVSFSHNKKCRKFLYKQRQIFRSIVLIKTDIF